MISQIHTGKVDPSENTIEKILEAQNNFSKFNIFPGSINLHLSEEFDVDSYKIKFNLYNTAWISRKHEKQGELFFPTKDLSRTQKRCDLSVSIFHHPYKWLQAENGRQFQNHVEALSDIILTGHDHEASSFSKVSSSREASEYIEGGVFANDGSETSEYNLIIVDLKEQKKRIIQFHWNSDIYQPLNDLDWTNLDGKNKLLKQIFRIKNDFNLYLNDIGALFTHPRKDKLTLNDIYIYPNLKTIALENSTEEIPEKYVQSEKTFEYILNNKLLILFGQEKSGKTSLCKKAFCEFYKKGYIPIIIDSDDLRRKHCDEAEFRKLINKKLIEQYDGEINNNYNQAEKKLKVIIVDNFHRSRLNANEKQAVLNNFINLFDRAIIFSNETTQFEEINYPKSAGNIFSRFTICEIMDFSDYLRDLLIGKGLSINQDYTINDVELFKQKESLHKLTTTLLGKNLIPSFPLYILVILQQVEANITLDTPNGSYGYLYEFLIKRSLDKYSSREIDWNTKHQYLAELAFKLFDMSVNDLNESELQTWHKDHCEKYKICIDFEKIKSSLVSSLILEEKSSCFRFKYKYVYYYFIAKYFHNNLHKLEIKEKIKEMSKKVYVEQYANIIIFLSYFSNEPFLINEMLENAKNIFSKEPRASARGIESQNPNSIWLGDVS